MITNDVHNSMVLSQMTQVHDLSSQNPATKFTQIKTTKHKTKWSSRITHSKKLFTLK